MSNTGHYCDSTVCACVRLHVCVCVCVCALLVITGVAVGEQRADGQQDLGDGEGGTPVVLQDVQTDHPLAVDVAVVDPGAERHLGNTQVGRDHISYIYI